MRNERFDISEDAEIMARRFIHIILQVTVGVRNSGEPFKNFPGPKNFTERLSVWATSVGTYNAKIEKDLGPLHQALEHLVADHKVTNARGFTDYLPYTTERVDALIDKMRETHSLMGGGVHDLLPANEDVPIRFTGEIFLDFLEEMARESGSEQYVEFFLARIRTMLADTRMSSVILKDDAVTLEKWLGDYIGKAPEDDKCITVIDLSLVPAEIVHLVTSVIARMCFESLQRYRKIHASTLPTVLVMEEAHTFVKRYRDDSDDSNLTAICCQIFEKIAREGRKFGLGLVLSSQRPSELSPTVLSQCNTFLLHRISNDRDQELIHKLVPDNLRGLLRELPSLPSQNAILLGWASELPVMVRMNDLPKDKQPQSADPDFWDVWTGIDSEGNPVTREPNWSAVVDDWSGPGQDSESVDMDGYPTVLDLDSSSIVMPE